MINQQLLDYIKQQSQQGVSNDEIKKSLLANGWQSTDVEEAFSTTQMSVQPKKRRWKKIALVIIGIAVVVGIIYFAVNLNKNYQAQKAENNISESGFQKPIDVSKIFCSQNVCTIAMVIKKENYDSLIPEVSTWISDVEKETGNIVELKVYEDNVTKEIIKKDLKDLYFYKNLRGVVLVGNIPYAKAGIHCTSFPTTEWPCLDYTGGVISSAGKPFQEQYLNLDDYYYVDIDNKCNYNKTADAFYIDSCERDSTEQPFWISRLTSPIHAPSQENKLLKNYFLKNHQFRNGQISFQEKFLVYTPLLEQESLGTRTKIIDNFLLVFKDRILSPYKIENVFFIPPEHTDSDFFRELDNGYEYVYYNGHGTPFFQQKYIYYQTIVDKSPKSLFYEFASCSVGRYSEEKYLAGAYLFNSEALIVLSSSVPIFVAVGEPNYNLQLFLASGKTIGDTSKAIDLGAYRILGDGTLRLRYKKVITAEKPEILLDKVEFDLGKLPLSQVGKKEIFKIKNAGNALLAVNIVTMYPAKRNIVNGPGILWLNPNEDLVIKPNEIKEFALDFDVGSYSPPQTHPYTGKYSGFFYLYTNDPDNEIIKITFRGETTE